MELKDLIAEYEETSIKLHLEDDFVIKKKYIDKSNAIIKKVVAKKQVQAFFETLFLSNEPWVLADAARDAFNCYYDLHKALSIMEYLRKNANKLIFCSDKKKNNQARTYYSTSSDINIYREEVSFYDLVGDDQLYRICYEYFNLIVKHIKWYYNQNNRNYKDQSDEIDDLLTNIKEQKYLERLFDIANYKYQKSTHSYNYLAVNSYYACKYNHEKNKYLKILKSILNQDEAILTKNLINLINTYIQALDKNEIPDLKII